MIVFRQGMVAAAMLRCNGLVVRGACGRQGWQDARGHGGARESTQDQHHHQHEIQAATHPLMIRRQAPRFPTGPYTAM